MYSFVHSLYIFIDIYLFLENMYIYIYVDILYIFICIDFWSEFAKAAATYFPLFFWPSWNFFFQEELPGPPEGLAFLSASWGPLWFGIYAGGMVPKGCKGRWAKRGHLLGREKDVPLGQCRCEKCSSPWVRGLVVVLLLIKNWKKNWDKILG